MIFATIAAERAHYPVQVLCRTLGVSPSGFFGSAWQDKKLAAVSLLSSRREGMPDNASVIVQWLKGRRGRYFCHGCISQGTGVKPTAQVNQIIRPLGKTKDFRYMKTTCSDCGADRNCAGYFG